MYNNPKDTFINRYESKISTAEEDDKKKKLSEDFDKRLKWKEKEIAKYKANRAKVLDKKKKELWEKYCKENEELMKKDYSELEYNFLRYYWPKKKYHINQLERIENQKFLDKLNRYVYKEDFYDYKSSHRNEVNNL